MLTELAESQNDRFLSMAARLGMLKEDQLDQIREHAEKSDVDASDSALTLSLLQLFQVDAIKLLLDPKVLAPGYELTDLLGCGAAGMVFRARQTAMARDVALKTINIRAGNASTTGESRILREAHAIARLHHPNIVSAFDSGFFNGRFCIAMELVEGENLASYIQRCAPLKQDVAWQLARQVASALSHANDEGIIHRDIKPANLLLTTTPPGMVLPDGIPFVKVVDFGLALEKQSEDSQLTAAGTTLGTPAYVAPEQLFDSHVDSRADIYSLGVTVYHMLTGEAPGANVSPMQLIIRKTMGEDAWRDVWPVSVSQASMDLFRDMTATKPEDRLADYGELIDRIDAVLIDDSSDFTVIQDGTATVELVGIDLPSSRWGVRGLAIALACALGVAFATVAGFYVLHDEPASAPVSISSQWVPSGSSQPLFNGQSVPFFSKKGQWAPTQASDGANVLRGVEGSWMEIPLTHRDIPTRDTRVRISVLLDPDGIAEVALVSSEQAAKLAKSTDSVQTPEQAKVTDQAMLRIFNESAEFYAQPNSTKDPFVVDTKPSTPDEVIFQGIEIYRCGDIVSFQINGAPLGNIASQAEADPVLLLRCRKGDGSFGDINIIAMVPVI